jgi:signal transduction histidine kinase
MTLVLDRSGAAPVLRRSREAMSAELVRLRRLAVVAPFVFLTLVAFLVRGPFHEELHSTAWFLPMQAGLGVGVFLFSFAIFALIASVERQLVQRNLQLEAVLAVARETGASASLREALAPALEEVLAVTSAQAAEVWLLEGDQLALACHRGAAEHAFGERTRLAVGEGLPGVAAGAREPVLVHDLASDARFVRPGVVALGFESFGAFPLTRRGELLGVLAVAAKERSALACPVEQHLLAGIGEQLAVAIENAQLHARVLDAAVLEERERLARELHDGVAQVLGYVNAQTLGIKKLIGAGDAVAAEHEVGQLEAAAKSVFVEVREAILGLRAGNEGLLEGLHTYVAGVAALGDLDVRLEVGDGVEALVLPPSAEIQLVRIVQEALTNVRKHARAGSARVSIGHEDDVVVVEIADDGRGFDAARPRRIGWPHFGLQTMRERTEALGGRLEIDSAPGSGTTVRVSVPTSQVREVSGAGAAR